MTYRLLNGDCIEVLKTLPDASVDAVVTDPPYGLSFMGKDWDAPGKMLGQISTGHEQRGAYAYGGTHSRGYADNDSLAFQRWCVEWARECLRVLKPGGHLLSFGGTRTYHRMACAIEDAGFEIRDSLHWIYGSGFPKSHNLDGDWSGWGTALKPAHEPVVVARKPLVGTVAANVLAHGAGALNIDGCRLVRGVNDASGWSKTGSRESENHAMSGKNYSRPAKPDAAGRWPPNILLSHTPECGETCAEDCAVAEMDRQSGIGGSNAGTQKISAGTKHSPGWSGGASGLYEAGKTNVGVRDFGDRGGASRFFPVFRYQAKASRSERGQDNKHPTVKPVALMAWLVKLVTPPSGTVLDPFMGSGTTGVAAVGAGFAFIGIEREAEYFRICEARVASAVPEQPEQKELFA